jgi:hypothetical protein
MYEIQSQQSPVKTQNRQLRKEVSLGRDQILNKGQVPIIHYSITGASPLLQGQEKHHAQHRANTSDPVQRRSHVSLSAFEVASPRHLLLDQHPHPGPRAPH